MDFKDLLLQLSERIGKQKEMAVFAALSLVCSAQTSIPSKLLNKH